MSFEIRQADGRIYAYGKSNDVSLHTLAKHLSKVCRFAGATSEFYSVAQHCVVVEEMMWNAHHAPMLRLQALLHDAHEAFLGDIPTPLQDYLEAGMDAPFIHSLKDMVDVDIFRSLNVPLPTKEEKGIIKVYDELAFCHEAKHLITNPPPCVSEGARTRMLLKPWEPPLAEKFFYDRLLWVQQEVMDDNGRTAA